MLVTLSTAPHTVPIVNTSVLRLGHTFTDKLFRLTTTPFRAIDHILPVALPLLAPGKGTLTGGTDLRRQIGFAVGATSGFVATLTHGVGDSSITQISL